MHCLGSRAVCPACAACPVLLVPHVKTCRHCMTVTSVYVTFKKPRHQQFQTSVTPAAAKLLSQRRAMQAAAPNSTTAVVRGGGRQGDQLRTLICELSLLDRADGSAKWSQDNTSVLAAVYGPRQAQQRKDDAERAILEVVFKPRAGLQGACEREYEGLIREALEGVLLLGQFPRTSIMIVLQVLQDDGSLLAVALNAACAALADAGVPMRSMFSAASCGILPPEPSAEQNSTSPVLLDPDTAEHQRCMQVVTLAFPHSYNSVQQQPQGSEGTHDKQAPTVVVMADGSLLCHCALGGAAANSTSGCAVHQDQFLDAFDACRAACSQLAGFLHGALCKSLKQ